MEEERRGEGEEWEEGKNWVGPWEGDREWMGMKTLRA